MEREQISPVLTRQRAWIARDAPQRRRAGCAVSV